ncbi:MAG: hypothetical protein ACYS9X_13360 [Planctomycetota bacterium]
MAMEHARRSLGPRGGGASHVLACIATSVPVMMTGCAAGRIGGLVTVDVTRVRVEPSFNGEGTDPADLVLFPLVKWHEDRSDVTVTCTVRLPRGFALGAGVGAADYSVVWGEALGGEDGVLLWRAVGAWQCGSRTVFRLGARYESVEDSHVLDHEEDPDEQRYEFSTWTCRASVGRTFGSTGIHVGVERSETTSRFVRTGTFANDFGLSSESTTVFVRVETVEGVGGVFGSFEAGGTPGDGSDTYRLATSVGVSF